MKNVFVLLFFAFANSLLAQTELPYAEIPALPEKFSAGTVAARVIDGLGFRYYWATDGLRKEDLAFKPNADARTTEETLAHVYEMSFLVVNATLKKVNVPGQDKKLPFAEMRKATLENFKTAADNLRTATETQMKEFNFIYFDHGNKIEYPFWNLINGPIEDCLWHIGQVVSFRRSSGNPFREVDLFLGKK
ncbi:MAG: hypothetical protein JSS79_01850 [Bacteroidetes bacterium]|nr:hypothetical protein [Bacteroidota bacterium]